MEHDRANVLVGDDALAHSDEPIEHVRIERIAFFGARHANCRDVVLDAELYSFSHGGSLVEDDGLVVVDEDSVVKVPAHGARQHDLLEVATLADQVLHGVAV